MRLALALLLAAPLVADAIVATRPRVEYTPASIVALSFEYSNNTAYWQRMKIDCDAQIDANAPGGGSLARNGIMICAGLINRIDGALTHSGTRYNGEKYARVSWIYQGAWTAAGLNADSFHQGHGVGFGIAYDLAFNDQTGSATEVASALTELTSLCTTLTPAGYVNPNIWDGIIRAKLEACAAIGDQTNFDVARGYLDTYITSKMTGTTPYMEGGAPSEGPEYGKQSMMYRTRCAQIIKNATGENLAVTSAAWAAWFNGLVSYFYSYTTPTGRGLTFSYAIPGGTATCTNCTFYELPGWGDNQDQQNSPNSVRLQMKGFREGALYIMRWFREASDTTRAANMWYWLQTFSPWWTTSSMSSTYAAARPWITDFVNIDPAQTSTNYFDTSPFCEYIPGELRVNCRTSKTSTGLYVSFSGGLSAPGIGHSHFDPTTFQVYLNGVWPLVNTPGYGRPWQTTVAGKQMLLPNGHGALVESIGYQGEAATPTAVGTMVYAENTNHIVAENDATLAFKFSTASGGQDLASIRAVIRTLMVNRNANQMAVLDRVKLNTGIIGVAPTFFNCPPVSIIARNTVYNATNQSNWVGTPASQQGHIYKLTTAGTTAVSLPSFNTSPGSTTADGTAIWTEAGENCTVSGNTFVIRNAASSQTNPVAFSTATTYGTVIGDGTQYLAVKDNRYAYVSAVRDQTNPSPLRIQMARYYSGGVVSGQNLTLSGATGACASINGVKTITVPNQAHTDGRPAYFTINGLDATGLGMNGCLGQNITTTTTPGGMLGWHITAESAHANTISRLTFLSFNANPSTVDRSGTGTLALETDDGALYAAIKLAGSTCAGTWTYGAGALRHFAFGFPVSSTCYYSAAGGTVTVSDSPGVGYNAAPTDAAGSFSFTTGGASRVLWLAR